MSPGTGRGLRALGIGLALAALVAAHGLVLHIISARFALGGATVILVSAFIVALHLGLMGGVFARLHGRAPPD